MKIKQKIITLLVVIISLFGAAGALMSSTPALAACGGAKDTSIINCPQGAGGATAKDNGVWGILIIALNIMTAGVGILAVGGIVYGAILYASAGDNASQTKQAIELIRNVVIGVISFGLMYMVLNFLIPGGIFS
jgi:hypothetical protein